MIQKHLKDKVWISHGLERFLWDEYNIYPSVTGFVISEMKKTNAILFRDTPMGIFATIVYHPTVNLKEI